MFYIVFDFMMAVIIFLFGMWFYKSEGKATKFLSGYNMKSADERKKYDENAMCKAYGKRMMFMSVPFIIGIMVDIRHQGISEGRAGLNQLLPLHTQGGAVRRQSRVQPPRKHGHNIPHPHRRRSQNDLATPSADRLQQKGGKSAFVPNFRGVEFKNAACAIFRGGFSLPRRNQSPQFAAGKPGGLAEQALIHAEGA